MPDFKFQVSRESHVEDNVIAWAENNGWVVRLMSYRGRTGCPDTFFFGYGGIYPIEFKQRKGKRSANQVREHERLAEVGVVIPTFDTVAEAVAYLRHKMTSSL